MCVSWILLWLGRKTPPPGGQTVTLLEETWRRLCLLQLTLITLQSVTYLQTLKCLCFHQDCYEGDDVETLSESNRYSLPTLTSNLTTLPIGRGNSQNLYKPRKLRVPERNYLLTGYRGDVGVTDQTRVPHYVFRNNPTWCTAGVLSIACRCVVYCHLGSKNGLHCLDKKT